MQPAHRETQSENLGSSTTNGNETPRCSRELASIPLLNRTRVRAMEETQALLIKLDGFYKRADLYPAIFP